ncbi:hypothetical protein F5141DRAFT_1208322 [Pisolithus sp. B1]|nr:hypothetical protein F5141DRAFT_1208322 [Pisolithus sp. B1]
MLTLSLSRSISTQEEQLIELMLTLKNTTPDQARSILASAPQIAYALITLIIKMNAVDVQVLQYNRTPTPQTHTPTHYNGQGHPSQPQPQPQPIAFTGQAQYGGGAGPATGYGVPPQQQSSILPDALASLPEEQKVMIMRVVSMTPEQISMLPPSERAGVIQLRTTLGLPS